VTGSSADDSSGEPFGASALPVDDPDELAGVVDLFGALTSEELTRALVELAYRQRGDADESAVAEAVDAAVEWAVDRYYLVEYHPDTDGAADGSEGTAGVDDSGGEVGADGHGTADDADADTPETLVTVGPVSFPSLPPEADDLPHILDHPTRSVSRASLARAVESRLRGDAARAVAAADEERVRHLFDVTFDLEAWAPVDVSEVRARLDDELPE
jgi:hypothetical protein